MNRVVVIGLVCLMAFAQIGWCNGSRRQAPAKECSEGFVDIIVDIVTAPCSLLAACLSFGVDSLPFSGSPRTSIAAPTKKISEVSRSDISPGKTTGAPLPQTKRTADQNVSDADSRQASPPVRMEKYTPQEKPLSADSSRRETGLPSSGSASSTPVPKQAAGTERPSAVQPGQELLEKLPGDKYQPPKANVTAQPSGARVEQLSPAKADQPVSSQPRGPETAKTDKSKPSKSGKSRYGSPCMPVYPVYPCRPGPFFR